MRWRWRCGDAARFADFADSVLGRIRPAVRSYLFYGANGVPLRFSFSGSEGTDSIQLAGTFKLALVGAALLVAMVLFWSGRLTARSTPNTRSHTDALLQGSIVGAVYLLLLLASTFVQPRLHAAFEGAEATLTLSPSTAWTLMLGGLWALFAVAGALSAVGASVTAVLCRAAPRGAPLFVGLRASATAWAVAVPLPRPHHRPGHGPPQWRGPPLRQPRPPDNQHHPRGYGIALFRYTPSGIRKFCQRPPDLHT